MQARKENKSLNRHKEMKNKLNKLKNNKIKLSNMVKSKGPHIQNWVTQTQTKSWWTKEASP